ncbi:hypothetical protein Tco_1559663 [Tanacetum coccineum]
MSARDKTSLGYGTQLNEMSNNSKTNSEISLSVFDVRSSDEESTPANDRSSKADGYHAVPPPITGNFLTPRADCKVQNMTTAGTRAVVNTGKGKMDTDLKNSRWVWRSKGNYLDHVSKDSGSFMLKKVEYVDPKGISKSVMAWISKRY